ncbi:MAG TPA: hypothetical protein VM253_06410 [Candidatus Limnocylindrales bacterium]|jgi:hypothetical protein|nr:hypothetical protein [Candidatus Limnocylindrales bacterium]
MNELHTWEIWYPGAGATGLEIARARIDPQQAVWVHAVARKVAVTVRQGDDRVIARGEPLTRDGAYVPMTRFRIEGDTVQREDRWPTDDDLGSVVILPGGEAGILTAWWNAEDRSAWRWSLELSNRRR